MRTLVRYVLFEPVRRGSAFMARGKTAFLFSSSFCPAPAQVCPTGTLKFLHGINTNPTTLVSPRHKYDPPTLVSPSLCSNPRGGSPIIDVEVDFYCCTDYYYTLAISPYNQDRGTPRGRGQDYQCSVVSAVPESQHRRPHSSRE